MDNSQPLRMLLSVLTMLLLIATGCMEPVDEPGINEAFDEPSADLRLDTDELAAPVIHQVDIHSQAEARKLFADGVATFSFDAPFQQIAAMLDAEDLSGFEYRVSSEDGSWSAWREVPVIWNEGKMYNVVAVLDRPTTEIQMRGGEQILGTELQFYEEAVANLDRLNDANLPGNDGEFPTAPSDASNDAQTAQFALSDMPADTVTRHQWGAAAPNKVCGNAHNPYRMAIHHTAVPSGDMGDPAARMRQMQSFHISANDWCDIGYHFVVSQSGEIFQGRSRSDRTGAHAWPENHGNIGISFIADFNDQTPSQTQLDVGARAVEWVHDRYGVALDSGAVKGHREWSPPGHTTCPGHHMMNTLDDLIATAADGGVEPEPVYDVDLAVRLVGVDDFYRDGSSEGIGDVLPGQAFQAHILLTNRSDERLESVEMGYSIDEPFLHPTDYRIYTDHPDHDAANWRINDADPTEGANNPATLSSDGTLQMHGFAPDESKLVVIDVEGAHYSIGQIDHAEVRAWLTHADDVFEGSAGTWNDVAPETKLAGDVRQVRDRSSVDVLSTDEWLFDSMRHEADLEGWRACYPGHHDELIHNTNFGAMALNISGDRACVTAPEWTDIDADTYDELVISVRSHNGPHETAVYWASDDAVPEAQFPCSDVDRTAGPNRYASAAAVSEREFSQGADTAIVALGDRPTTDAVVASSLAAHEAAPLLLTSSNNLPDATRAELSRLGTYRVVIVGGEAAVSREVENELASMGMAVERHAGATRYATANEVAREIGAATNTAVIISGDQQHLVDGVYGSTVAADLDAPVLLVAGDTVPSGTQSVLDDLDIDETIIIGGESAVSSSLESQLPSPLRLAGATRYDTANEVARFLFDSAGAPEHVFIARDDNVIDAFSASAAGDVVLLSRPEGLTYGVAANLTLHANSATLVGGTAALSEQVERDACEALHVQTVQDNAEALIFEAPGDGDFHTFVVPMDDHPEWSGDISYFALMPLYDESPGADDSRWYDVGKVFFQNSDPTSENTSSDVYDYTRQTLVSADPLDDPVDPTTGDGDVTEPSSDNDTYVESGCTAIGGTEVPESKFALLLLFGLIAAWRKPR